MQTVTWKPYQLNFKFAAGTSRGILHTKKSYFIFINTAHGSGIGECSLIEGLSPDARPDFEQVLDAICKAFVQADIDALQDVKGTLHNHKSSTELIEKVAALLVKICIRMSNCTILDSYPAIRFGLETAILDYLNGGTHKLYPDSFAHTNGHIPINGLVWMGSRNFMEDQIRNKIEEGYSCIKMKIGAIDFSTELDILSRIRKTYSRHDIEIRLDANGAFSASEALKKLEQIAAFDIHSVEQPIVSNQYDEMAALCRRSPVPIALDEELIGIADPKKQRQLLEHMKPQWIVLKPGLLGGVAHAAQWIELAVAGGIGWWVTSALESNIGLNAIAQWVSTLAVNMPQGLGTGKLFHNNFPCPLEITKGTLVYDQTKKWDLHLLNEAP